MNKNMSFEQYQKKYITSFDYQYDTISNWGFYINIEKNEDKQATYNIKNTCDIDESMINESMIDESIIYENRTLEYDKNIYILKPIINCLLKTAPCVLIFYCFI